MHAMVVAEDGDQVAHVIQRAHVGAVAEEFGASVAEALVARGALELLQPAVEA